MAGLVVAILALIQGLTEFLPVSSSGHLVVAQELLGWKEDNVLLDAVLHLGTALSIVVVFRKDIAALIAGATAKDPSRRAGSLKYAGWIVIGSIPAGLAGILFQDFFERLFLNARAAGGLFLLTAAILFLSRIRRKSSSPLSLPKAGIIGLAQALAVLPGVSRSGTTISTALLLGADRKEAGRFSFLLGLPIIAGAALWKLKDLNGASLSPGLLLAAFAMSAAVGVVALKILLRFVERGRLHYFGYYLVVLGLACLIFL